MKLCDRCRVSGCLLNYLGTPCRNARHDLCPDVLYTNADAIREMDDRDMAEFLAQNWGEPGEEWEHDMDEVLEWLREPVEGYNHV